MDIYKKLKNYGDIINHKEAFIFFGNKKFHPQHLDGLKFDIRELWQVHGREIVEAQEKKVKADAHWTKKKRTCLLIKTADCMPVFLSSSSNEFVCGIHIGWRGLMQKILSHSLEEIKKEAWKSNSYELWVGPHIGQENFCLDTKLTKELLAAHGITMEEASDENWIRKTRYKGQHYDISLSSILYREAKNLGVAKVHFLQQDTFSSLNHYSYRRYRYRSGRQYSFIVKA